MAAIAGVLPIQDICKGRARGQLVLYICKGVRPRVYRLVLSRKIGVKHHEQALETKSEFSSTNRVQELSFLVFQLPTTSFARMEVCLNIQKEDGKLGTFRPLFSRWDTSMW